MELEIPQKRFQKEIEQRNEHTESFHSHKRAPLERSRQNNMLKNIKTMFICFSFRTESLILHSENLSID